MRQVGDQNQGYTMMHGQPVIMILYCCWGPLCVGVAALKIIVRIGNWHVFCRTFNELYAGTS